MTDEAKMSQSNSIGAKGVQIGKQIVNCGLGYKDTKDLCLDLIKEQLNIYKNEAALEAEKRNNDLLNAFIRKISREEIDGSTLGEAFKNPDMQYTYVEAQKAYIRSGAKDLEEVLSDLLVSRIKEKERSLLQIALREAITVVPMLIPEQLDALALCFLLRYTQSEAVNTIDDFRGWLDKSIIPFSNIGNKAKKDSFFTHLSYTKAGNVEISSLPLEGILLSTYRGLFCLGYKNEKIENYKESYPELFTICLNDDSKWQIRAINEDVLNQSLRKYPNMTEQEKKKIVQLFRENTMSEKEIVNIICKKNPIYRNLFELWNNTLFERLTLTTVGIVLGAMRIRMVTGDDIDMGMWV